MVLQVLELQALVLQVLGWQVLGLQVLELQVLELPVLELQVLELLVLELQVLELQVLVEQEVALVVYGLEVLEMVWVAAALEDLEQVALADDEQEVACLHLVLLLERLEILEEEF